MKILGKSGIVELTRVEYREAVRLLREKGYGWKKPIHGSRRELHDRLGRCVSDFTMDQCLDGSRLPRYYLSEGCLADLPPGWPQPPCPDGQGEGRLLVKLPGAESSEVGLSCLSCGNRRVKRAEQTSGFIIQIGDSEYPL